MPFYIDRSWWNKQVTSWHINTEANSCSFAQISFIFCNPLIVHQSRCFLFCLSLLSLLLLFRLRTFLRHVQLIHLFLVPVMVILQTVVVMRTPAVLFCSPSFGTIIQHRVQLTHSPSLYLETIVLDGYPQFCDTSLEIDSTGSTIESIVVDQFGDQTLYDNMNKYWTDINGNNKKFWAHEFNKHGTCLNNFEPILLLQLQAKWKCLWLL